MNGFTTEEAEKTLSSLFERTKEPTKYIAGFRTRKGRELALQRARRNMVSIWAECLDQNLHHALDYKYYEPHKPRSSNLKANARKLAQGKAAWYITFRDPASLEGFLDWYKEQ